MHQWKEAPASKAIMQAEVEAAVKRAQLDLLNWFMQLCGHGYTTGMIRKIAYNKFVEISGEGEKA